jgi:hypothetical protein
MREKRGNDRKFRHYRLLQHKPGRNFKNFNSKNIKPIKEESQTFIQIAIKAHN